MEDDSAARESLHSGPDVLVRVAPDDSVVLVAFGGHYMRVGIADYEFFDVTNDLPCGLIFIRDRTRRVYHKGIAELGHTFPQMAVSLRDLIGGRRWVAIGNSGGSFAALLFGALAGADQVHAFAAVTFLDERRRRRIGDDRFAEDFGALNADPRRQRRYMDVKPWLKRRIAPTEFHLYYAQAYDLDRLHAERLREVPGVRLHPLAGKGHGIIRNLAVSGELTRLLHDAVTQQGSDASVPFSRTRRGFADWFRRDMIVRRPSYGGSVLRGWQRPAVRGTGHGESDAPR